MTKARRWPYPPTDRGLTGRSAIIESPLGIDRVDIGVLAGTPRIIFEDATFTIWEVDNSAGTLRFFTPTGGVKMTLDSGGTLAVPAIADPANTGPYLNPQSNGFVIRNRGSAAFIPLYVFAMTGQTGDLTRWYNAAGAVAASIDANGVVTAARFDAPTITASVRSTVNQTIPAASDDVEVAVAFDTVVRNNGMTWDGTNNELVVVTAGHYILDVQVKVSIGSMVGARTLHLFKNPRGTPSAAVLLSDPHMTPGGPDAATGYGNEPVALQASRPAGVPLAVGDRIGATFLKRTHFTTPVALLILAENENSPVMTATRIGA